MDLQLHFSVRETSQTPLFEIVCLVFCLFLCDVAKKDSNLI